MIKGLLKRYKGIIFTSLKIITNRKNQIVMKLSLTYKKTARPTGLASVGAQEQHSVKLNKVEIGSIMEKSHFDNSSSLPFGIQICVLKTPEQLEVEPNCVWRWLFIGKRFNNADEAKEWLDTNIQTIWEGYHIYDNELRVTMKPRVTTDWKAHLSEVYTEPQVSEIKPVTSSSREDQVRQLFESGITSPTQIAKQIGSHPSYISSLLTKIRK